MTYDLRSSQFAESAEADRKNREALELRKKNRVNPADQEILKLRKDGKDVPKDLLDKKFDFNKAIHEEDRLEQYKIKHKRLRVVQSAEQTEPKTKIIGKLLKAPGQGVSQPFVNEQKIPD